MAYWVAVGDLSKISSDRLTQQAIAAAAYDAISRLDNADTIVLSRVFTQSQGENQTCATVLGRGLRLKKAGEQSAEADTAMPEGEQPRPAVQYGYLTIHAKPPCEIYVDDRALGAATPQNTLKLAAGSHRITLVNQQYDIKETFSVEIEPDRSETMVKDFSTRMTRPTTTIDPFKRP